MDTDAMHQLNSFKRRGRSFSPPANISLKRPRSSSVSQRIETNHGAQQLGHSPADKVSSKSPPRLSKHEQTICFEGKKPSPSTAGGSGMQHTNVTDECSDENSSTQSMHTHAHQNKLSHTQTPGIQLTEENVTKQVTWSSSAVLNVEQENAKTWAQRRTAAQAARRLNESESQRSKRLQADAERARLRRAKESDQQRNERLQLAAANSRMRRANRADQSSHSSDVAQTISSTQDEHTASFGTFTKVSTQVRKVIEEVNSEEQASSFSTPENVNEQVTDVSHSGADKIAMRLEGKHLISLDTLTTLCTQEIQENLEEVHAEQQGSSFSTSESLRDEQRNMAKRVQEQHLKSSDLITMSTHGVQENLEEIAAEEQESSLTTPETVHEQEANVNNMMRAPNRTRTRKAAAEATRRQLETESQRLERLRALAERARTRRVTLAESSRIHGISGIATTSAVPGENYLGSLRITCDYCGALFFENEAIPTNGRFNLCCNFGNVRLDLFADFPEPIRSLLTGNTHSCKNFRQHIRSYNSALAMASMGAQVDTPRGYGPYCYRIHGQVYHFVGPLEPEPGTRRQYGQLYILDTDDATAERLGNPANEGCDPFIMRELTTWFHAHNEYAASFKMMGDIVAAEERKAQLEQRAAPKIRMIFDSGRGLDRRRYNVPVANEVAVVFVGEDNDVPATRSLAVHHKDGRLRAIQDIDGRCDPLTYPLFFPRGGLAWQVDLTKNASERIRTRITQREFYSYLFSVRPSFNPLHHSGKLLQQFAVDAYVKTEQNRLNYTRTHQKELRVDSYQGLMDHLASDDAHEPAGQRVILPATFRGGPRAMHQSYQDAMSIVAKYGKPDYFLTFTCNPRWREISENLYTGQTPSDRPDIVARVFHRKLKVLQEYLFEKSILGRVAAYVGVVEWQKRGLPHCHMLLIMAADAKPRNADQIDAAVQAYLPDAKADRRLFDIVVSNMVHRRCGATSLNAPCMVNGVCSKNFPKEFREETVINADGYPRYKRPNDGRTVVLGEETFDNRHIVPYNRYLLLLLNAHINLEICGYIQAVKYLYKYVYKGPDRASLRLLQNNIDHTDEIRAHLDARYVCSPEALHHIFMYECQFKSDTVYRLQVHLPNFQNVMFPPGGEREAVVREASRETMLTAWFKLNTEYEQLERENSLLPGMVDPRSLYYYQLPEHFTFVKQTRRWKKRGRGNRQIGRMYMATPKHTERYSLRLLLLHRKNMRSFEDLRTVDDQLHPTFAAAARALGFLHDDAHHEQCLEEAACFQMPAELRALFCYMLAFCDISDPVRLFERFKNDMCEDFVHRGSTPDDAIALAYYEMSDKLETLQCDLSQRITPPTQTRPLDHANDVDFGYHQLKGTEMFNQLNHQQRSAAECILTSFDVAHNNLHFVDGPGGSGKTFLYNAIYHIVKGLRKSVICVAWTGIAASLLPEGRTASSTFKLNMHTENRDCMLRRESSHARPLKDADLIIWDEISMVPKHSLEAVDLLLKDLMCNTLPFGGKAIVLGGDFRQVLPIAEHGSDSDMVDMCVKNSYLWKAFRKYSLRVNMRTGESDSSWSDFLINVGNGDMEEDEDGCIEIPQDIISNGDLIAEVFGDEISDVETLSERAILAPRNTDVNRINEEALSRLPGEVKEFKSIDEVTSEEYSEYSTEFLNSLTPAGLPPHNLRLKKGAIVMLLRNLDVKRGLCNGTRLIVTHFGHRILGCIFASGERKGQFALIPKIDNFTDKGVPSRVRRRQFPIRLAFAMTINKAQGQSLTSVGVHLGTDIFSHGQLYVALSRARAKEGVKVLKSGARVRNIVVKAVL